VQALLEDMICWQKLTINQGSAVHYCNRHQIPLLKSLEIFR